MRVNISEDILSELCTCKFTAISGVAVSVTETLNANTAASSNKWSGPYSSCFSGGQWNKDRCGW
jgi:hypothetical protein